MNETHFIIAERYYTNHMQLAQTNLALRDKLPKGWVNIDMIDVYANRCRFLIAGHNTHWTPESVANLLRQLGLDGVEIIGRVSDASKVTVGLARPRRRVVSSSSNRDRED